jgi:alkenylglycerophosphocholine/alkenylglycerophosphoethanolamine hydrolase
MEKLANLSQTDRRIFYVSLFFGLLYWGIILVSWALPVNWLIKWLAIIPLALLLWRNRRLNRSVTLAAVGLFIHSIGDIVITIDGELFFLLAIVAFLIGHLFYLAAFWPYKRPFSTIPTSQKAGIMGIVLFALIVSVFLVPSLDGAMKTAVPIYILVITAMAVVSWLGDFQSWWIRIGVVSYMVSDSVLAYNAFVAPVPFEGFITWPTYYFAQLLIAVGFLWEQERMNH